MPTLSYIVEYMSKRAAWWLDVILAVVLVTAALAVRTPIAIERKIMPAGDVFNFQHIAVNIIHGIYPHKERAAARLSCTNSPHPPLPN